MTGVSLSCSIDRRTLLIALGVVPATISIASGCSGSEAALPGPDLTGADQLIRPQDDLYRHVNGTWLREFPVPPDKPYVSTDSELADRVRQQLRTVLEKIRDPAYGSDEQKLQDFYEACLDVQAIERLGLAPIADMLDAIANAGTKAQLAEVMGSISLELPSADVIGACGLFALVVFPDGKDSATYRPQLGQAGLRFKASFYHRAGFAEQRDAYRGFLARIATLAGFSDPLLMADRVLGLESRIAAAHWEEERTRDADAVYNPYRWSQMPELAPGFDWDSWLTAYSDDRRLFDTVIVAQPSYVTSAARLWSEVDIADWRDYLRLGVIRELAALLPRDFADANFDFFDRIRNGQQNSPARIEFTLDMVSTYLDELLGRKYVEEYFSAADKARAEGLVADIVTAYRESFAKSEWMSPTTRAAAIAKIDKLVVKIGYPAKWHDHTGLSISAGRCVANLRAAVRDRWMKMFAKLGRQVDRFEWRMSPQTVNASYDASDNTVVIPAAILQPPYFNVDGSPAVDYGGIGAIIAHEIGHGFDDQGAKFDGDGNLRQWWTAEDRARFEIRIDALIAQYDALVPEGFDPTDHVNGALTVGENLADLRGLSMALAAYRLAARRLGKGSPDHRDVFLSYSRVKRAKFRPELVARQLVGEAHAPAEFRCNQVVRNLDEFYDSFDVRAGDQLFLPADRRVRL